MGEDGRTREKLIDEEIGRERAELERAERTDVEAEERAALRRADRAAYLREKLEEQAESERG
jgi:uncharacterized caspase-like protein